MRKWAKFHPILAKEKECVENLLFSKDPIGTSIYVSYAKRQMRICDSRQRILISLCDSLPERITLQYSCDGMQLPEQQSSTWIVRMKYSTGDFIKWFIFHCFHICDVFQLWKGNRLYSASFFPTSGGCCRRTLSWARTNLAQFQSFNNHHSL